MWTLAKEREYQKKCSVLEALRSGKVVKFTSEEFSDRYGVARRRKGKIIYRLFSVEGALVHEAGLSEKEIWELMDCGWVATLGKTSDFCKK